MIQASTIHDSLLAVATAGAAYTGTDAVLQNLPQPIPPQTNSMAAIIVSVITGILAPIVKELIQEHRAKRRAKKQSKKDANTN